MKTLRRWKAEHEAEDAQALAALGEVTEATLQQIISAAIGEHDQKLRQVLGRLERNDAEAAQMLRDILHELDYLRHNLDQVEELSEAAWRLYAIYGEGLGDQLERASQQLYTVFNEGLGDQLNAVADKLNRAVTGTARSIDSALVPHELESQLDASGPRRQACRCGPCHTDRGGRRPLALDNLVTLCRG